MKNSISVIYFRASFEYWFRKSGLSQVQAGARIGISQSLVTKLLRGERSVTFAQADKIASELKMTLGEMLEQGKAIVERTKVVKDSDSEYLDSLEAFELVLKNVDDSAAILIKKIVLDYANKINKVRL